MADLSGLSEVLQSLRNEGMLPHVMGDIPSIPDAPQAPFAPPRLVN
jgi:hypothetical protein